MPPRSSREREILAPLVSDPEARIYLLNPAGLPGLIGPAMARYSRTPGGLRDTIVREFIGPDGVVRVVKLHRLTERILIAFGDDSVQELESAWIAVEGVSNIVTKVIEDRRLAGFIEQSSRFTFYDEQDEFGQYRYLRVPEIMASACAEEYVATMDFIFATYSRLIKPMIAYFGSRKPLEAAEYAIRPNHPKITWADCASDNERVAFRQTWNTDLRTKTCDILRILLPMATLTNVGVHANGRTLELMLRYLYSSNLQELPQVGREMHDALNISIPQFVQRAGRSDFMVTTEQAMLGLTADLMAGVIPAAGPYPPVQLLERGYSDVGAMAAMLFPYTEHTFDQLRQRIEGLAPADHQKIWDTYLGHRTGRRDRSGRALEYGSPWQVQFTINVGIWRDLHRHRMLTQLRQRYTTRLGFDTIPPEIVEAGFGADVQACFDRAAALYEAVRKECGPEVAQYTVPFGALHRSYFGFNNREAQHLIELRTGPQGHRSYRLVCQELARQMAAIDPRMADICKFIDQNDYDWPRADSEARQRAKESALPSE